MYVVMGGTGHVGSAVVSALLARGEEVTIVSRRDNAAWRARGADVVVADVDDIDALRAAFRRGRRAFLLNPPGDIGGDFDAAERRSIARILAALDGSGLEKLVAASTYGVQPGQRIGDLSTLWEWEEGLRAQPIPTAINRGAYYMSNWDAMLEPVRDTGILPTFYPADLALPMVAPADLGHVAAERLMAPIDDVGIRNVEGPAHYSSRDVADAFARALGRSVDLHVVPPERWEATYREQGFSAEAAGSFTRMLKVSVEGGFVMPEEPTCGPTTLDAYIAALVARPSTEPG